MTKKSFEVALKKGEIGERIIEEYFQSRGWVVYKPSNENVAHYFDMLLTKDKQELLAVDVKTKARLNKWNAQGINIKHYEDYIRFTERTGIPFYIIFIDDKNGDVHAAELKLLRDPIKVNEKIIAWPLEQMFRIHKIDEHTIKMLTMHDQRNYKYNPI